MTVIQTDDSSATSNQIESGSFSPDYAHHQRLATPGPELVLPQNRLKWYQISRPDVELPKELIEECRLVVQRDIGAGRLDIASEQGFAMLHVGDEPGSRNTFAMLFVCTWRNGNELWRTLYTKSLRNSGEYQRYVDDGHSGAFCVWELGPVWHERQAWNRFLYSARDEAALDAYLADLFAGPV